MRLTLIKDLLSVTRLPFYVGAISSIAALATSLVGAGLAVNQYLKPLPPIPQLPSYSTSWLEGGHNQREICESLATNYHQQFPNFQIEWRGSENSKKDWLGHVQYRYNCDFTARHKS